MFLKDSSATLHKRFRGIEPALSAIGHNFNAKLFEYGWILRAFGFQDYRGRL